MRARRGRSRDERGDVEHSERRRRVALKEQTGPGGSRRTVSGVNYIYYQMAEWAQSRSLTWCVSVSANGCGSLATDAQVLGPWRRRRAPPLRRSNLGSLLALDSERQ